MPVQEANYDGLVGPTHNYAGLSKGNVASTEHRGLISRPRDAALEGLGKMRALAALGLPQGVIPPQERPHMAALRRLGFEGNDRTIIERVGRDHPTLLAWHCSASSMWTANAATVAPSSDARDGRVHLTTANLASTYHRSLEPSCTARALAQLFPDATRFVHHQPLPLGPAFGDEGAANHGRLWDRGTTDAGTHLFVYGRSVLHPGPAPQIHPARQTLEASQAVARLHQLEGTRCVFAQQAPGVIDAGVFHNDVIAVAHEDIFLFHEDAFVDTDQTLRALREAFGHHLVELRVTRAELSVEEAVKSYLFNSQLVTTSDGRVTLVAPSECEATPRVRAVIERLIAEDHRLDRVIFLDVRQSMQNGGGPACLRLRVPLTADELASVHAPCLFTEELAAALETLIRRHYREQLAPADLADPALLDESRAALDDLTQILELGAFYDFQRADG